MTGFHVLEKEDHQRDADFSKAMHGQVSNNSGGLTSVIGKDKKAAKEAAEEYFKHWTNDGSRIETEEEKNERLAQYATLTRHYYNLATDFYENGWGQSFRKSTINTMSKTTTNTHPQTSADSTQRKHFIKALLAYRMGLKAGMKVLDVGCGVGGPAREIAQFTDTHITGLNNNDYQIARAGLYAEKAGLSNQLNFVKGDFMQMSFPHNTFDAVYAIEATVHAPSLEGVYKQIYNSLKPGGVFGVYEWLMTDRYDPTSEEQRKICRGIELGNGISQMVKVEECLRAIKAAGFELEVAEDLAERDDAVPWYYPLAGDWRYLSGLGDVFTIGRMTRIGRGLVHAFVRGLEVVGIAPPGSSKTADSLATAADSLVAGGKLKIFTPMYLVVARKPKDA